MPHLVICYSFSELIPDLSYS